MRALPPALDRGFTLVELIVVLGVISILVASAVPLAGAAIDADRRVEIRQTLAELGDALATYYYDHAAFPPTLTDSSFFGVYVGGGVGGRTVRDPWGTGAELVYSVQIAANEARVHSRGENGVDDGFANEEWSIAVPGSAPGLQRTHSRMRVIIESLVLFLANGGSLTGDWSSDRASMGLGAEYQKDGFGVDFTLDAAAKVLRSAGPDRVFGTSDDLTS
ncbi:MAG: hypothetical protein Fur0037_14810 [Planctomycetota bacterium]